MRVPWVAQDLMGEGRPGMAMPCLKAIVVRTAEGLVIRRFQRLRSANAR